MNKKERVLKAIHGEVVDGIPSSFSLHFPTSIAFGDEAVEAHLAFSEETDVDILKIMNENLVPYMGEIQKPSDYSKVRLSIYDMFMRDQLRLIEKILSRCDQQYFTLGTVHGITASAIHPLEKMDRKFDYNGVRAYLTTLMNENPTPVVDGMKRIADTLCDLVTESMKLGLDGIYYAALGGETRYFTDEQFATWIEPLDKMVLQAIKEAGGYRFLHICKDQLNMDRYREYGNYCEVVNWGVYEAPYSLEEGEKLFPECTIMGGLESRSGVLVHGTSEEIISKVHEIVAEHGRERFILGADCTLDTFQDREKVRIAVEAARGA